MREKTIYEKIAEKYNTTPKRSGWIGRSAMRSVTAKRAGDALARSRSAA